MQNITIETVERVILKTQTMLDRPLLRPNRNDPTLMAVRNNLILQLALMDRVLTAMRDGSNDWTYAQKWASAANNGIALAAAFKESRDNSNCEGK
jgi:hypothetical protein